MEKKYSFVVVTSAQPSANPRMLKEVILLSNLGFEITVVWCPITPWADYYDKQLFEKYSSIKWVKAGYHYKEQKFRYNLSRIRKKIWYFIYRFCGNRFDAGVKSMVMFSQEMTRAALKYKADIYIGHNLGSISSIVKAAKKFNAETIFDFEDFYRGELDESSIASEIIRVVEYKYVPKVKYFTAASCEIANAYKILFQSIRIKTILNVFPIEYSPRVLVNLPLQPLKLFWFSQYVGKNRGLENVIEAVARLKKYKITITFLGYASEEIKNYFLGLARENGINKESIIFLNPVSENELVRIASMHHIGLASEISSNLNREFCLTNKIFIYLLAGNAILFSNTKAQQNFMLKYKMIGQSYDQNNLISLKEVIEKYLKNPLLLDIHRRESLCLSARKFNWNLEQEKIITVIRNLKKN